MSETYVERTCTRLAAAESGSHREAGSAPLSAYRSERAIVLLGDAGAGKSREFRRECEQLGDAAVLSSVRDFVTFDVRPDWCDKTVFIDGLDEVRAGTADGRTALDEVRKRLDQLGWPGYRISCREADWLGSNDRRSLESVTPGGTVAVLRLDPLDRRAKDALVAAYLEVDDTSAFFDEAEQCGLGGMLDNPLTLQLLASAFVHGGERWPANRRETFKLACEHMARERNDEHIAATDVTPPLEAVLAAAGEFAAIQLLAGIEGFSLGPEDDGSPYFTLDRLQLSSAESFGGEAHLLRHVLGTRLFSAAHDSAAVAGWPRVSPLHRHIAEFLGGRYLAGLVQNGLPARRIVALMVSPHDGRVVTSLRGLSAWFAAHCSEARDRLIDVDPVGIGLYGDISRLDDEQRQRLLRTLAAYAVEGPLLGHQWRDNPDAGYRETTAWAFRSIVDAGTVDVVADLLRRQAGDLTGDRVAGFLLRVLAEVEEANREAAKPLAALTLAIVREPDWSAQTRRSALDAFIHLETEREVRDDTLMALLADIVERRLTDPEDDLAGLALRELYPQRVTPAEVWSYMRIRTLENYHGTFGSFWSYAIIHQSSAQNAADALEALWADLLQQEGLLSDIGEVLRRHGHDMMPVELLVKALHGLGDDVDIVRLFSWLAAAASCGSDIRPHARQGRHDAMLKALEHLNSKESERWGYGGAEDQAIMDRHADPAGPIRAWLERHPDTQRNLYLEWLNVSCGRGPREDRAWFRRTPLFFSKLPRDLGRWCLEQALVRETNDPDFAREILRCVVSQQLTDADINEGLTLDHVIDATSSSPLLNAELERLLAASPLDAKRAAFEAEMRKLDREHCRKEREHRQRWIDHVRDNLYALSDGSFPVNNLDYLAHVYFGHRSGSSRDESGEERLAEFLHDDNQLTAAVTDAFIAIVFRAELPAVDETISLHVESKHAWTAWPLFAGLQLAERDHQERLDRLDDARKRQVIATYLCVLNSLDRPPPWLVRWLVVDPELVSDVLVRCVVSDIRAGSESSSALNELDVLGFDDTTKCRVRRRVLKAFPASAPIRQLRMLDSLLFGVLRGPVTEGVQDVIDTKLAAKSLTVAQRARWLATAAFLFQGRYVVEFAEFSVRHPAGCIRLAEFLHHELGPRWGGNFHFAAHLETATLEMLVAALGGAFEPLDLSGDHTVAVNASEWISDFINQLSASPESGATEALQRLEQLPEMSAWRSALRHAREAQSRLRSDTEYRVPTVAAVQWTLSGGVPANAADLTALVLDWLDDTADEMRGIASDPWQSFWNVDSHGRPERPKPENVCRNAILTALRGRARPLSEVELTRESSAAADKRADIGVSCSGSRVPIEIKLDSSRDLWHALRRQLIGQYTTDPATDGYGIYLILWFGGKNVPTPSSGRRPSNPQELREMLEQNLSIDEVCKIAIRVIDVTKPDD